MRIKYENIAILLFLLNLIVAVVGIVLIQDTLEIASHTGDLDALKTYVNAHGYEVIIIIILQVFVSCLLWITGKEMAKKTRLEPLILPFEETQTDLQKKENHTETTQKLKLKKERLMTQIKGLGLDQGLETYCSEVLSSIAKEFQIVQGVIYLTDQNQAGHKTLKLVGGYAYFRQDSKTYEFGEGLAGQVAKAQRTLNIQNIPKNYIKVMSGLGESTPSNLLVCPMLSGSITQGVMELASFVAFNQEEETILEEISAQVMHHLKDIKKNTHNPTH